MLHGLRRPLAEQFGLGRLGWLRLLGLSLWIGLGAYLPLQLIAYASMLILQKVGVSVDAQPAIQLFVNADDSRMLFGLCFLAMVVAPIGEEILFRGFFQPIFKGYVSPVLSIAITSVLFSAMHLHAPTFLPLLFLGGVLGIIYECTGSLSLCIGLHMTFNSLTVAMLLALRMHL
jgi:uncharacterized protein